jgi:hypothetical protein
MADDHRRDPQAVERWASSGALSLTGHPHRSPLGPPAGLVAGLDQLAAPLPGLDPLTLLTERAAWAGLERNGRTTCGGAGRLLRAADGWLAISLPRPDDVELVPAWLAGLGGDGTSTTDAPWDEIAAAVGRRSVVESEERAALLGLAVGGLATSPARQPVERTCFPSAPPVPPGAGLRVLDLSALWAGPLCGALLGDTGATIVKVESSARPDGARRGSAGFFDRLNASKASVVLDLDRRSGVSALRLLVERADVVIESSRPRALQQLGIDAATVLAAPATRPRVWVSITAHGRAGAPGRVGFGDDAAVAGGLVSFDENGGPVFCADAIADPCTGLAAASACLAALTEGGRWLLDVALSAVAASLAGPTLPVPTDALVRPPVAPAPSRRAPAFGADTNAVLGALGAAS